MKGMRWWKELKEKLGKFEVNQRDKESDRQTDIQKDGQPDRHTSTQKDIQTNRQARKRTYRQTIQTYMRVPDWNEYWRSPILGMFKVKLF